MHRVLLVATFILAVRARGEEGLWTFEDFPAARVEKAEGLRVDPQLLERVRLASLSGPDGCAAAIVSPAGLVVTSRHCARACLGTVPARGRDLLRDGHTAASAKDELPCPGLWLEQLAATADVTARVDEAVGELSGEPREVKARAVKLELERACAPPLERCQVVALDHGRHHRLYTFRRYTDVRLAFAPELAIADFGGRRDRAYALDVALLRLPGVPFPGWLPLDPSEPRAGDPILVSHVPGVSLRELTVSELGLERDVTLPAAMRHLAELKGLVSAYQDRGPEQRRQAGDLRFAVERALELVAGRHAALGTPAFFQQLRIREADLRKRLAERPELERQLAAAFHDIDVAVQRARALGAEHRALETGFRHARLFTLARSLIRNASGDSSIASKNLLTPDRFSTDVEMLALGHALGNMLDSLGPDHAAVRAALGTRLPAQVARDAIAGSRVKELVVDRSGRPLGGARMAMIGVDPATLAASKDALIRLALALEPAARSARDRWRAEVEVPLADAHLRLARARAAIYGPGLPLDGTGTPRLSAGRIAEPITSMGGAFERHTGVEPFALPRSWLAARSRIDPTTPFTFLTSADGVPGTSGAPIITARGSVAGVLVAGNPASLGNLYGFDAAASRGVAVHAAAIRAALRDIHGVARLLAELDEASSTPR